MDTNPHPSPVGDDRYIDTIVRLFGIASPELRPALDQASDLVAQALGAQKVDVFLHEAAAELAKLTRRQHEIAACIAEGLSNADIAERLTLMTGTVANHVESILNRLGFRSRTQIAVWAVEHGLYHSEPEDEAG